MTRAILALALAGGLHAASLAEGISRLLASNHTSARAFWGIQIVDLASGKTLFEQNAGHFFVPASNNKLFTTAQALIRLGPEYTFQTRVLAGQPMDADGRIEGDIRLVGGGDPNLSARTIPYHPGPSTGDPLAALADLANQLTAKGVKRIDGNIVGDDTWYVWQPYPTGWSLDDPRGEDGAPVSALTINDNAFTLHIRPGTAAGDLAALVLDPPVEYYNLDNRVRTVAAGGSRRIRIERVPGSREVRLWGTIPLRDRGYETLMAVDDPALYAAMAFRQLLQQRGITVTGGPVAQHLYPEDVADLNKASTAEVETGTELAQHLSAPFLEDLRITAKVSQNLHAEMALRAVARVRRNIGSIEASREEMKSFLGDIGVDGGEYTLFDGSGLSRLDLVTPAAVVRLLRYMYESPARANWISLLPVGGLDGTLASRFADNPAGQRIHAKTGSLSHVSALSGYAERRDGRWVAFSILVNNYNGPAAEVHGVMDQICALIIE